MTKAAIFENSRWRTAAILKIPLSSYLSLEFADFDQICYTDADINIMRRVVDKELKLCKFKMADGRHIENRFLAICRRHVGRLMRNLDWI